MYIIAVDPGASSGIARCCQGEFTSVIISDPMDAVEDVVNSLPFADLVVVENFIPRPKVTWQPDALHIIGALRFACHMTDTPMELVQPAQKKLAPDDRLRRLGWYKPGAGHDNDAARHLLVAMMKRRLIALEDIK